MTDLSSQYGMCLCVCLWTGSDFHLKDTFSTVEDTLKLKMRPLQTLQTENEAKTGLFKPVSYTNSDKVSQDFTGNESCYVRVGVFKQNRSLKVGIINQILQSLMKFHRK